MITTLNNKQMWVLVAAMFFFSVSALFPPWLYHDPGMSGTRSAGYHFIYSPPKVRPDAEMRRLFLISPDRPAFYITVRIDPVRSLGQRIAITFMALGFLLIFSHRKSIIKLLFGGLFLLIGAGFTGLVCLLSWIL